MPKIALYVDFDALMFYLAFILSVQEVRLMKKPNSCVVKKIIFTAIFLLAASLISQEPGIRKSVADQVSGQVFNNFRSDSTEAVFYQVMKPAEFLYGEPKNNADAVYSLAQDMFVEKLEDQLTGSFIKVRVSDKQHGVIEGWVRKGALKNMSFFGRSFEATDDQTIKSQQMDLKKNPNWVKNDNEPVFSDSTRTGDPSGFLNKGQIVFVKEFMPDYCSVYYGNAEGILLNGYVAPGSFSELAIIPESSSDTDKLFGIFNPVIIKNDLDRSGFVSYSGIKFTGKNREEFTEDKVCREITEDSLLFRYSSGNSLIAPRKHYDIRSKMKEPGIVMYRILPDEKVVTTMDTILCSVVEYVSTPKVAKISVGNTEEASVTNSINKIFLTKIEKYDMYVVFHRETSLYEWTYSKDLLTGNYIKSDTKIEKFVKRLTAFRKH